MVNNEAMQAPSGAGPSMLRELIQRAESGDVTALPELRAILDDCPEIWQEAGDLGRHARKAWLDLLAGDDLFRWEAIERQLAEMRTKLDGVEPSSLERLLIDRILSCWLTVQYAEIQCAQSQTQPRSVVKAVTKQFQDANRHLQSAVKQLALLRKLLPTPKPGVGEPDYLLLSGAKLREARGKVNSTSDRTDDPELRVVS